MTFLWSTLLSCFVSALCLVWLARYNPRRRRAHGLPKVDHTIFASRILLVLSIAPGVALLLLGHSAGFVLWLGAISILGWWVAAFPPKRASR